MVNRMTGIILTGTGAAISWMVALMLLRYPRVAMLFHALIVGIICAAAECVIYFTQMPALSEPVSMTIFLLMTLAVALEKDSSHGNAILAFFTARSAFSVFQIGARCEQGIWVSFVLQILFAAVAWKQQGIFPEADWRDYFSDTADHGKKLNIRIWHVYGISVVQFLLCCACAGFLQTQGFVDTAVLMIGLSFCYWGALLCICLAVEYRRETVAALIEQQYRSEMQSFMNVIRSQRHDYNFHVHALARMLKTGDLNACEKYVDELVRDSIAMNVLLPVKDPAISALINNFRALAARDGIDLTIDIQNDLSRLVTTVYETNKVISNLLQNAIDEVRSHKDKSCGITLTILKRGEFCVIRVTNPINTGIVPEEHLTNIYRHGYTTKPGHDGVGLSSVKSLLAKYKGMIYTQVEGNLISFTAKIPLRYRANEEDTMKREENLC